ncbi:MAG TPA: HAD-IA family hydrolase [Polyangiaceae bacterium]|nr:HAD-IA family hydrolase [Polyangiaceae bacterium]
MHPIEPTLIREVDLLCLDAGNTVVFLEHGRLAALCAREGFATSAESLVRAEGEAKVAIEHGDGVDVAWSNARGPGGRGWGLVVGTMLNRAGLALERVPRTLDALWPAHRERNFWSLVPDGLSEALGRLRARGVLVAVISNSEGFLEEILEDLGILRAFDLVIDSGIVGVEKPDPAIFRIALQRTGVAAPRALHLGDTYATDVLGARAAGVRVALIDPYGHLSGRHPDVPRVPGAPEVADAIALARAGRAPT